MCAYITSWKKNTSVKFRTDVASICKLEFALGLKELNKDELTYCQEAVANWKHSQSAIMMEHNTDLYPFMKATIWP